MGEKARQVNIFGREEELGKGIEIGFYCGNCGARWMEEYDLNFVIDAGDNGGVKIGERGCGSQEVDFKKWVECPHCHWLNVQAIWREPIGYEQGWGEEDEARNRFAGNHISNNTIN